jgi:hypothetical protein
MNQERQLNAVESENAANPIRRVVNLLQNMAKKDRGRSRKRREAL